MALVCCTTCRLFAAANPHWFHVLNVAHFQTVCRANEFKPQVVHESNQPILFYLYQMIDEAFDHRPFEEAYVAAGGSKSIRNADFLANMRAGVALSMCIIGGQVLARVKLFVSN